MGGGEGHLHITGGSSKAFVERGIASRGWTACQSNCSSLRFHWSVRGTKGLWHPCRSYIWFLKGRHSADCAGNVPFPPVLHPSTAFQNFSVLQQGSSPKFVGQNNRLCDQHQIQAPPSNSSATIFWPGHRKEEFRTAAWAACVQIPR